MVVGHRARSTPGGSPGRYSRARSPTILMACPSRSRVSQEPLSRWTGATPGSRHETSMMIQRPNELFDVSRLAFAIAHPGMTRRLLFSLLEHESWQVREEVGASLDRGYGRPSPRRWNETDFYVALTGAVLADDWAQDQ